MGVKGLWRLLLPIGRRISIETLHGKVLAIDASIWLTQFLKAMRDPVTGKACVAAHLIGFFRRLCRLRFHGIKPVFVFDGATPEIKKREVAERRRRREQFAVLTDGSVQRLARKLLQETLQKRQKEAAEKLLAPERKPSGFVAGFNPGDQSERSESNAPNLDTMPNEATKEDEVIEILDLSSLPENQVTTNNPNDWDLPLAVAAAEEAKEMESESETEYEDFSAFHRPKPYSNTGEFAVDYVASLPAVQRKDAVEQAKREQRMQSRKEFMPAAANPATFSNVQLKNFLKSCQLNKDIHAMARTAAIKDSDGLPGEAMASDRTTRVELIREDEGNDRQSRVKKSPLQSKKRTRKESAESSDDEDWGGASAMHGRGKSSKNARRVMDDDEAEEAVLSTSEANRQPIIRVEGAIDLTEDANDAGLLRVERERIPQEAMYDVFNTGASDSDDDCDDGGGFLPSSSGNVGAEPIVHTEGATIAASKHNDTDLEYARQLQEREDQKMARALQREDEETFGSHLPVVSKSEGTTGDRRFALVAASNTGDGKVNVNDSMAEIDENDSSGEDDVDWEDGESAMIDEPAINSRECVDETHAGSRRSTSNVESSIPWDDEPFNDNEEDVEHVVHNEFTSLEQKSSSGKTDLAENRTNTTLSPETSAALQQARATAANLTDWAGRAFLRAIKEAGGESEPDVEDAIVEVTGPTPTHNNATTPTSSHPEKDVSDDRSHQTHGSSTGGRKDVDKERDHLVPGKEFDVSTLELNEAQWTAERNRRERDMDTISDEMLEESKQLLQLFGVPFVDAPTEAEAQCAVLEELGLVDGIVTEDSDVFVFGGKVVYKNIFDEQKYVEVYAANDAEKEMKLGRNQMVALAMLLGGDYTEGVKGVGIVNAMEILDAFDVSEDLKEGLNAFRNWLDGFDPADVLGVTASDHGSMKNVFHAQHWTARTRWVAPKNFPADNVMKAYLDPVVDKSKERFSWGAPDVENLIRFCNRHIGWPPEDTKTLLDPVMKGLQGGLRQTRIDSYMKYEDSIKFAHIRSKRLRDVLGVKTDTKNATDDP